MGIIESSENKQKMHKWGKNKKQKFSGGFAPYNKCYKEGGRCGWVKVNYLSVYW